MPVIINQTEDRVLLRFNSGLTRTMGPHEVLEVEHVEVKGNARIQRLAERRRIAIQAAEPQKAEGGARGGRGGRTRAGAPPAATAEEAGAQGGEEDEGGAEPEGESRRRRPRLGRRKNKTEE